VIWEPRWDTEELFVSCLMPSPQSQAHSAHSAGGGRVTGDKERRYVTPKQPITATRERLSLHKV